jgi:hypothetical protein
MSYDNPNRMFYQVAFDHGGAADETISIKGPKGKAGRLWDYGVYGVTEIFNGGTITPKIAIGTPADPDAYGDELDLHGLADNDAKSIRTLYRDTDTGFATYMVDRDIPADQEVYMTLTVATGSPTGQGISFCVIDWDN